MQQLEPEGFGVRNMEGLAKGPCHKLYFMQLPRWLKQRARK